jgi:hypothetical protein
MRAAWLAIYAGSKIIYRTGVPARGTHFVGVDAIFENRTAVSRPTRSDYVRG